MFFIILLSVWIPKGALSYHFPVVKYFLLGLWKKALHLTFKWFKYDFRFFTGQSSPPLHTFSYQFHAHLHRYHHVSFPFHCMQVQTPPAPFLITNDSRFNFLSPSLPLLPKWSMRSINTLCCKPTGLSVFKFEVILVISSFSITGLCFVMSLPSTRSVRTWALNMVLDTWKFRSIIMFIARLYGGDVKCRWIDARMLRIPLVE